MVLMRMRLFGSEDMRRWIFAATAAAALTLGGCGESPETNTLPSENAVVANDAIDNSMATNVQSAIIEMNDNTRNVVLVRALIDAGLQCQGVTESERVSDRDGLPTWRATCTDGTQHLVSFTADGTAYTVSRNN